MSGEILPLKIRVGIRDQWDSPNAPIRGTIDTLTKVLGHVVTPQIEWQTLFASLKDAFPDINTFVPAICRIGIAFYSRLVSRLENESKTEWTEKFVEEMSKIAHWKLRMEAIDDKGFERPLLIWNIDAGNFCIQIPKSRPAVNSTIEAGFDEDLDSFFGGAKYPSLAQAAQAPKSELPKEDDWADIGDMDEPHAETLRAGTSHHTSIPTPRVSAPKPVASKIEDLPPFDIVSRPAKLYKSIAPYVLIVNNTRIPLLIQGSHPPSLEYLAKYLKKWARTDPNNAIKRPLLKVETVESALFSDVIDLITVEPNYFRGEPQPLNPSLILGFVEGVLGYTETFTDGSRWVFKLDPESHSETSVVERNRKIL
ncbi:hypothetical protein BDN70DRAFT_934609 [Pholiota conissans]|uniref:Uncharacterized protein n=1 Tax=Pholiota conissans TaxID=109636 RepID=A0A9P6CY53_9AGAR|nr:hypothetical protein BDN70DRAFT_934609 [Pholiota conissans]